MSNNLFKIIHPYCASYPLHSRIHPMQTIRAWVKRDDELGWSIHGSKWRKYASLVPDLIQQQKPIALVGSCQSQHILSMTQLLKQAGIPYRLLLKKTHGDRLGASFFLSLLAKKEEIIWIDTLPHPLTQDFCHYWDHHFQKKHLFLPLGGCCPASLPGAMTLAVDFVENEKEIGIPFSHLFLDAGTGFTAAATILALHYLQHPCLTHIVLLSGNEESFYTLLSQCKKEGEKLLGCTLTMPTRYILHKPSTAPSFGSTNRKIFETIHTVAQEEGFFLDPLYTAKLFLTLRAQIATLEGNVAWVHSGGTLSLTGFAQRFNLANFAF